MKHKSFVILLIGLIFLAACSPTGGNEATTNETSSTETTTMEDEDMADEMMDDEMMGDESMDDEAMDDEMMDDESIDDEMMDEHDEDMADDTMMDDESEESMEDDDMSEEMMDDESEESMEDESMAEDTMMDDEMMSGELLPWQTIALTNAATGETFTLADFAGKTIFVEPMATWCTNCRRQLGNVADARAQLGEEDIVWVSLSVETNISDQELVDYMENTGFDWTFAVASPEMLQELVTTFGQTVVNPPSTPHFTIWPDGTHTDLTTGFESPDELIANLQG